MLTMRKGFTPEKVAQALKKPEPPAATPAPPPAAPKSSSPVHVDVKMVAQVATWAFSAWSAHKHAQAEQEQAILRLAHQQHGWLREIQVVQSLSYSWAKAQKCLRRLVEGGQAQVFHSVHGEILYVFPSFLPATVTCAYCDTDWLVGQCDCCNNCGAPLHPQA